MRKLSVIIVLCLVAAAGVFGYTKVQEIRMRAEAQKEIKAQAAERQECEKRLATFYQAVQKYQDEHKGAMPGKIEELLPQYIKDGDLLMCPTAVRWTQQRGTMSQGQIEVKGNTFPVTYGFRWLTSGYARGLKKVGDAVPLIVCDSHKEAVYQAVYHKPVPAGAFSDDKRGSLISEVGNTKMLAVLKNGKVEELSADQEF